MATQTETQVEAKASVEILNAILAENLARAEAETRKFALANCVKNEANKQGLTDKKQIRKMVELSFAMAYPKLHRIEPKTKKAETLEAFLLRKRPDVTKVMTLAYPDGKAAKEAKLGHEHNAKLPEGSPKANRIGENTMLEICRGNMTFAEAIAIKEGKKQAKKGSAIDSVVSIEKRAENAFTGILANLKVGTKDCLTFEAAEKAYHAAVAAYKAKQTQTEAAKS